MKLPKGIRIKRENASVGTAVVINIGVFITWVLSTLGITEINPEDMSEIITLSLASLGIGGAHHVAREHVRSREPKADATEPSTDYASMSEQQGE